MAACSIALRSRKFGVLLVSRKKDNETFSQVDTRNLSIFVSQMAQSIANTKLFEQLEIKISELEDANQQLEQTKAQLDKSSIEDPLSDILGCIHNLLEDSKLSPETKKHISKIRNEAINSQNKIKKQCLAYTQQEMLLVHQLLLPHLWSKLVLL